MLTQNSIQNVFSSGVIDNSILAKEFYCILREKYGYNVMASYYKECGKQRILDLMIKNSQQTKTLFAKKKDVHFYDDSFSKEVFNLLYDLMDKYKLPHHDENYFQPTFGEKLKDSFSGKKHIYSGVTLTCFDSLARWHILELSLQDAKAIADVKKYACVITCGWDEDIESENHYVLFKSKALIARFFEEQADINLVHELLKIIAKWDKWNIINSENYKPRFVLKSDLPNEKMFELLRG